MNKKMSKKWTWFTVVMVVLAVVVAVIVLLTATWQPGEKGGVDGPKHEPRPTQTVSFDVKNAFPDVKSGPDGFKSGNFN